MFSKIWYKLVTTVTGGAVLIAFFSIIAKLVGLFRDRLLASGFGADRILDIYYASFRLPDLIFNTLVLGALSAAFIPIFIRLWEIDKKRAWELVNITINKIVGLLIVLAILAIIFAPLVVKIIAPGFTGADQTLTVTLTRIMLLSIIFFGFSNVLSGVLNSVKDFVPYAIAPIFYNIGIIIGIVWLYPWLGVRGLAWGVVLGSILHLLLQLPAVMKKGWHYQFIFRRTAEFGKMIKLMLPRTIGLAANQINQLVITSIASTLSIGSIAVFNLANNLQNFPISIFGLSLAIAAFPVMSRAWATENKSDFRGSFSLTFRKILFFIIPVSVFVLILRAHIVRLVLGTGSFDWEDTYYTAQVLGIFALSLFAQGSIPLLARSFYSRENTAIPVIVGIISVAINLILAFWLSSIWGIIGLALAFSLANIVNMLLLLIILREQAGDLDDKNVILSVIKIGINSILSGGVVYGLLHLLAPVIHTDTFLGLLIQAGLAFGGGLTIYICLALVTNMDEILIIKRFLAQYFGFLFKNKNHHGTE